MTKLLVYPIWQFPVTCKPLFPFNLTFLIQAVEFDGELRGRQGDAQDTDNHRHAANDPAHRGQREGISVTDSREGGDGPPGYCFGDGSLDNFG
jgi:hypothetical protein